MASPENKGLLGAPLNSDPSGRILKITPSDTLDVSGRAYSADTSTATRGICCGTAGTATFIDAAGNTCTNYPLQAGYNPIRVKQIKSTGTTASDIWALF